MNHSLKEATVKRHYYNAHGQLRHHLYAFVKAYNFAKRLKTLKGLTPYEFINKSWQKEPQRFKLNPSRHTLGLNNLGCYFLIVNLLAANQQGLRTIKF